MDKIRNIAIIAHVDHGKTTLVDKMLIQAGTFRENENIQDRVMDSNDLERERGITILSKNLSIDYEGYKINIVDTPGHADFGGEVERVLKMVEGVLLLVDAYEGAMPQTRFVLRKALELELKPIVVINKIDRSDQRAIEVIDEVLDLFIELGADDEQIEFPVLFASAKDGHASTDKNVEGKDLRPLFEAIIKTIPSPNKDDKGPLQLLVSSLAYNDYVGRMAVGRVERGVIKQNDLVVVSNGKDGSREGKISNIYTFSGLNRKEVKSASAGEIVIATGIEDINIGETICAKDHLEPLSFVKIDEPTISMNFLVNDSPFAGQEGDYVTSRHLRDRLFKEIQTNVSLKVEETESADRFKVSGRGELHLSILIETMRREGYEFQVSKPEVIFKEKDGKRLEPYEDLYIEVIEESMGVVMKKLGLRKAELLDMSSTENGYMNLHFSIPSRCLIGYRQEFLTDTKGNGIMNHVFKEYGEYKGEIQTRTRGSLIAFEQGESVGYGLYNAQERGKIFIKPAVRVYEGMVIGENSRQGDMVVNVCKKKQATNVRASGSDDALKLSPPVEMSLEESLEFIAKDEYVEITPQNIRLRKKVLNNDKRTKLENRKNKNKG